MTVGSEHPVHLGLGLDVLGVPDHLVLRPALDTALGLAGGGLASTASPSVLRGSHHQGGQDHCQALQTTDVRVSPSQD